MNRRGFLKAATGSAAGALLIHREDGDMPIAAPVGLTVDQALALPKSNKDLLYAWVVANGVSLDECKGVWIDGSGAAHFNLISRDARGKFVLHDGEVAEFWMCVPHPTRPPKIAWMPWQGVAS